jgi:hypothetical protein
LEIGVHTVSAVSVICAFAMIGSWRFVSEASADASTYSSRDDDAPGPKPGGLISVAAELAAYSGHLASDVPIQDAP